MKHLAAILFTILLTIPTAAQSTFGSIRGITTDTTAAAVPDTSVTLRSVDQSTTRTTTSDATGAFAFENLKPGKYILTVAHDGFSTTNLNGIALDARQDLRLTLALTIATDSTTVEVTAGPDQINTEDASLSDTKNNTLITQLPLNNRATTTSPLGALTLSASVQQDSNGYIALGGASSSMINFSVDGISTANVRQNGALQDAYPSQEGIASVKVTAFNNSAEFSQVGDVTFTTRTGTNSFHGSLFEYLQNNALDASPYGFTGKAPKHFNTFGGSLGGPVAIPHIYNGHDKTFFFFDYEGNRRATATLQQFLVPSLADRTGNLADICGPTIAAINATSAELLTYIPKPNLAVPFTCVNGTSGPATFTPGQSYNYENFQPTPSHTDGADLRIDQTIGSRNSLYARFSRKNISSSFANPFLPDDIDSIHNRSLLVSDTFTITPRLLNEARYGFTNVTTSVNFPIQGSMALTQLGLTGVDISQHPLTHAFPTFNFSSGTGFTPIGRDKAGITQSRTTQISDNLTYTLGHHTLKAGIDVRHLRYFDLESFAPEFASDDFGNFVFQPTYTGNSFGDFLTGRPTTSYFAVSSPDVGGTATQYSVFLQDEFQLNSRLTLSYGLRWQVMPSFSEDGGNLANFDQDTNSIVVPDNLAGYLQQQGITSSNIAFQQSFNSCQLTTHDTTQPCTNYITASQAGLPQGLRQTYKGNFQPRVAFAYRPFNDTKTVLRGGFGIYTITNLGPLSFNNSGNPTSNLHIYTGVTFPATTPPSTGPTYGGGGLDQGVDPHFRDPQANQWSLTLERQLSTNNTLRASYVGMHTYRLSITEDLNQTHASTLPYNTGNNQVPYANWSTLYSTFNAGKANYSALELELTHRTAHGLYYNANYTLAKNQADNQGDTPSGYAGEVNYGIPIADRFHINSDYGNEEGTRRHRFLGTAIYDFPSIHQLPCFFACHSRRESASPSNTTTNQPCLSGCHSRRESASPANASTNPSGPFTHIAAAILNNWSLNTITLLETGPWLTPSISPTLDQSNTNVVNRGAYARPDSTMVSPYLNQSRTHYYNPAAFTAPPPNAGRFGTAGVGILQGPGTVAISLGAAKVIPLTATIHLRFESTFTNVLNHTNFAPPATQIDNTSTFGQLTSATTAENAGNRTGQLALRLDF